MDDIFHKEITQGWLKIYMDNLIIVTENNETDHTNKVLHILKKLQDHDLYLKLEKCHFHKKEAKYLRVIISNGNVKMDPMKIQGINDWPTSSTVKEVCSFLEFCNFYQSFIPNFLTIAHPLNNLIKKNEQ